MLNLISISAIFRKVDETSQYHNSVPDLRYRENYHFADLEDQFRVPRYLYLEILKNNSYSVENE